MISKSVAAVVAAAAVTGLAVAACSSSSSSTTGTERFTWSAHGNAATAATTWPITYSGVVNTTGNFDSSGPAPAVGQEKAFPTKAGTLTLKVTKVTNPQGNPTSIDTMTCVIKSVTTVDYTVVSDKSTDRFKDATGSGVVTLIFSGTAPKLSDGKCNTSSNVEPVGNTASLSFAGVGPMTVSS